VNKVVNKREGQAISSRVHTVLTACPQLIHRVILNPADFEWLKAWFQLGKLDRGKDPRGAPRHHHGNHLSALGHLTILAYQLGTARAAWSEALKHLRKRASRPARAPAPPRPAPECWVTLRGMGGGGEHCPGPAGGAPAPGRGGWWAS